MSLNKVTLIGNVGQDPEIRSTQDGKELASFSLATTESWKDKNSGEKKDKTEWHRIVVFGPLAGIVKNYVKKGSKLYIEGQLKTREWTDKEGVKRFTTEIILQGYTSNLQMLDSRNTGGNSGGSSQNYSNQSGNDYNQQSSGSNDNPPSNFSEELDDDIPF